MTKVIESKYCNKEYAQITHVTDRIHVILSTDEIILLKIDDQILISKYDQNPSKDLFPEEDNTHKTTTQDIRRDLYEYNRAYLNFICPVGFYGLNKEYCFKGSDKVLHISNSLEPERTSVKYTRILDRETLEREFNLDSYDSMYLLSTEGKILYAYNKKDGQVIGKNIIPTDKEIIQMDFDKTADEYYAKCTFGGPEDTLDNFRKACKPKKLDEVKQLKIYYPLLGNYKHLLVTSKNGKFQLAWLKLEFLEKDKFKITLGPVRFFDDTIEDIIGYLRNTDIIKDRAFEETKPEESKRRLKSPKRK